MTEIKENKMGTLPVNRLLVSMSLPMVISMMIQALYNIVDSVFVSQISENAFTAVSLAFSMQNLMIAVVTGTGVGINAMLSKSLGEKNFDDVNKIARNGIFLAAVSYVVFLIIGLTFTNTFFTMQTDNPEIIGYGTTYLSICLTLSFGCFGAITFEKLLQSTGRTVFSMIAQIAGAVVNIILDPILIFGYFGAPEMGIAGAAIATVAGQICAAVLGLIFNVYANREVSVSMRKFRPDARVIKRIYSVGVPSIIMVSIGSLMYFLMNKILIGFNETAAAVFGAYYKLQGFVFMPVFGLNNGLVPIVAYNYGARHRARLLKAVKLCVVYAFCLMAIGTLAFELCPELLLSIFNPSALMLEIGVSAFRIMGFCFLAAAVCIVLSSMFQALGHGVLSMLVSIARQLVVLIPVAYLLSLTGNLSAVWWAFPIADVFALILSVVGFFYLYNKVVKHIPQ